MSFKRLDPEDFLLSTDAIVAPAFANGSTTNTGTTQGNSGISSDFYTAVLGSDGRVEYYYTIEANISASGTDINKQVIYK